MDAPEYKIYLSNIFTVSSGWNRQHHDQTIHLTEKLMSNEFVQNSLGYDMHIIIFDLHGYGGC